MVNGGGRWWFPASLLSLEGGATVDASQLLQLVAVLRTWEGGGLNLWLTVML